MACLAAGSAAAAELIMVEEKGCPWCERWHEEIGPAYPKTEEGQRLPLRRVMLSEGLPDDIAFERGVGFTPTFIAVACGREVGRINGYPGDDFFWPLLDELIAKLPDESGC